jgi:hypothetical protein
MTKEPSTNQPSIISNQTSTLKDIELDAVVGGSFLSAVKEAVMDGAHNEIANPGGSFGGVAMKCGPRGSF